ncbi:MAG TPA: pitrilysin family protein [Caulobacteraceae bacterium]|jgi:predicted Zn-dependent peptidase
MSPRLHTLPNGVRVVCDPMPGLDTFALSVVFGGGARWEPKNRSGWSHLLEHMVFKGAGGRSAQQIAEAIEAVGAQSNAATGYERTSYQIRALAGRLPLSMEILADMALYPTLDPDELEREKQVVAQEIAESFDTPDDHVFEVAQTTAFGGTALGRPILGSVKSIGAATPLKLGEWRAALYPPERTVVSVAGAADENEVLHLAERFFGSTEPGMRTPGPELAVFVGGDQAIARKIEQANLVWQLPGPGARDRAWFDARLFAELLGGGMASRLFQEAREKRGLAYNISAWAVSYEETGQIGVFAGAAADDAEALGVLVAEQILAMGEGVSGEELARGKAQLETSLFMARESPVGRAERAAAQVLLFGRVIPPEETRAGVNAVTSDSLRALVADILAPKKSANATLGPRKAAGAGPAFTKALFG